MKFCQNFQFLTFVIFVAEVSNKHFCKLDKIFRNFCSWQFFVFVTVLKIFGFETRNFEKWSCDTLEHYCTRNHIALLIHLELLEITSRCYSTGSWPKSHRVAISLELLEITSRCYFTGITPSNHSALLSSANQSAYCWFLVSEKYNTVIRKTSPGRFQARCSQNRSRILKNIREKSFLEFHVVLHLFWIF